MYKKTNNRILKKLKVLTSLIVSGILSLMFTNGTKASNTLSDPIGVPLYGIYPTPGEILFNILPYIGGVFLVFVIAPIVGLNWYHKRGGTKKWPSIIVWAFTALFILALLTLIIYLYSQY